MTALLGIDAATNDERDGGVERNKKKSDEDDDSGATAANDKHDNHDQQGDTDGRFGDATTSSSSTSSSSSSCSTDDGPMERDKQPKGGEDQESAALLKRFCNRDGGAETAATLQNTTPTTRRRLFPTLQQGVRVGTATTAALRRRAQQRNSISHPVSATSSPSSSEPRQVAPFTRVVPLHKDFPKLAATPHSAPLAGTHGTGTACDKALCGQIQQQQQFRIAAMERRMRSLESTVLQLCKRLEHTCSKEQSSGRRNTELHRQDCEANLSDQQQQQEAAARQRCSLIGSSEGDQDEEDIEDQDTAALEKAVNVVLRSRPSYIHRSPSVRWSILGRGNDAEDDDAAVAPPTGVSIPIPLDSPFPTPRLQPSSKHRITVLPTTATTVDQQQHLEEGPLPAPPLPHLPDAHTASPRMPGWSMPPGPPLLPLTQPRPASELSTSPDSPLPQPAPLLGYRTYTPDYEAELLRHRTGEELRRRTLSLDAVKFPLTVTSNNDSEPSSGLLPRRPSSSVNEGGLETRETEDVGLDVDSSGPAEMLPRLFQQGEDSSTVPAKGPSSVSTSLEGEVGPVRTHSSASTLHQTPSDSLRLSTVSMDDQGMDESARREEPSPPKVLRRLRATSNASSIGSTTATTLVAAPSSSLKGKTLSKRSSSASSQLDEHDSKHTDGRSMSQSSRPRGGSVNSQSGNSKKASMLSYVKTDLLNVDGRQQDGSGTEDVDANMEEFLHVPSKLESVLLFGSFICVDAFLNVITLLPLKFVWSCFCFVFHVLASPLRRYSESGRIGIRFHRRHLYQLLNSFVIYFVFQHVLCWISIGKLYHWIRGQDMIKLYVLVAIVEVFDRLMCSLGQDALDSLYWNTTRRPQHPRMIVSTIVVFVYVVVHSLILLVHVATLNVAMNSADQALLTLLISGNFAEIKSFVFKKYSKQNLFKIAVSDICERFKLVLFLGMIFCLNCFQGFDRKMVQDYFQTCGIVLAAEVLCDWIKHSFMTKFNFIKSSAYFDYSLILAGDVTGIGHEGVNLDHTHAVVKRLGLALMPLVCVWLRYMKEGVRYALMSYESSLSHRSEGDKNDVSSWVFQLAELYTNKKWGGLATAILAVFTVILAVRLVLGFLLLKVARRLLDGPSSKPTAVAAEPQRDTYKSYHTSSGSSVNSNKEKTS